MLRGGICCGWFFKDDNGIFEFHSSTCFVWEEQCQRVFLKRWVLFYIITRCFFLCGGGGPNWVEIATAFTFFNLRRMQS